MSAKREKRDLANFLASHRIYADAELPVPTQDGIIIQLWPRSTTTIADIEKRGVPALRTAFAMPHSREVEIIGDGSVAVHLSRLPAPEAVEVDRIAPWRQPKIAVVDAEGNAARLPQDAMYSALRRVTHSSGDAYLALMQDARLTSAISYTEGRGTVTEHQVPPLRRIVMTRTGAVMVLGMGTITAEQWSKAESVFRSHLRAPRLVIRPRLSDGEVDVELRAVEPAWPRAVALPLDALDPYPSTRVPLGVDELGEVVWWEPKIQAHLLTVGSTGGGKSVALRGLISAVLAASTADPASAWSVLLADGKGSDYSALAGVPGVRAVSAEVPLHVWLVATARKELDRRRAQAARDKARGIADPYAQFPPLLVLLDEWADVSAQIASRYGKKSLEAVQSDIASILRVGREARIHLVLATQELRVEAVPGSWQENLKTVVSLGRPSQQTLRVAFPGDELREAAGEIAAQIPQSAKGRAMVVDADSGAARAFQSFWQYSPGTTDLADAPDSTIREAWAATAQVLGTRPRTAPRVAPEVPGPEFRDLDVDGLRDMAPVLLDLPTGPDPDAARFDPASPGWLGAAPLDAGSGMDWDHGDTPEPALTNDPAPMTQGPATSTEPSAEVLGQLVVQMRCAPDDLAATALSSILLDPRLRELTARELTALLRDDPQPTTDTDTDDPLADLDDLDDLLKGL